MEARKYFYRGSICALSMLIHYHYHKIAWRIQIVSSGLTFGGFIVERIFRLVSRGPIFGGRGLHLEFYGILFFSIKKFIYIENLYLAANSAM